MSTQNECRFDWRSIRLDVMRRRRRRRRRGCKRSISGVDWDYDEIWMSEEEGGGRKVDPDRIFHGMEDRVAVVWCVVRLSLRNR